MERRTRHPIGIEISPTNIEGIGGVDLTRDGEIATDSSDNKLKVRLNGDTKTIVTEDQTQVLTNKTIDADLNTISNLEVDNLKSGVINVSTTLSGASDVQLPSALAVKTYIDDKAAAQNEASEISYDPTASGLVAVQVQAAIDEVESRLQTNETGLSNHLSDSVDAHDASAISVAATGTLLATDVQAALIELESEIVAASGSAGTVQTNLTTHINNTTDAHDASAISNIPSGNLAATNIQLAVNELQGGIDNNASTISNHLNDTVDAHDASAISSVASGNLAATDVQTALNELQSDIDTRVLTTGGSVISPVRLDFKQDTHANLVTYASTATDGQAVYATDTDKYYGIVGNVLTSFGGGSSGLSTVFQLTADELITAWSTGNNASFLGGGTISGTFAYDISTPLHGAASYKYTQAAGSLNDYISSATQPVDIRFRGQTLFLSFPYQYDGSTSDIQIILYDVTNSAIITSTTDVVIGTNGATSTAIVGAIIPLTCANIKVGFQVKVLNSGKILEFDDVQLSTDITSVSNVANITDWIVYTPTFVGFGTPSAVEFEYRQNGQNYDIRGKFTSGTTTGVEARIGLPFSAISANSSSIPSLTVAGQMITNISSSTQANFAILMEPSVAYVTFGGQQTTQQMLNKQVANGFISSGNIISIIASIPIAGLTSYNSSVVVPTQQVSSDTMSFAFKATAINGNDAIGTFNTYTYAANTNTATISATAPTQTVASMNVNGVQVFARAYNATSTAASPARVDIFIGKGLKSKQVDAYGALAKTFPVFIDKQAQGTSGIQSVGSYLTYNEATGILSIDAGFQGGQITTATFKGAQAATDTDYTSGYFVFNASKSPSLLSIPNLAPRIAYLSETQANTVQGGSSIATTWTNRTLNTLVDNTGIVTSLTSNNFVLQAGTYSVEAKSPAYNSNSNRCRIRNITDGTTTVVSISDYTGATSSSTSTTVAIGEFTITSAKTFALQYYVGSAQATIGLGASGSTGENEVYGQVKITRIK